MSVLEAGQQVVGACPVPGQTLLTCWAMQPGFHNQACVDLCHLEQALAKFAEENATDLRPFEHRVCTTYTAPTSSTGLELWKGNEALSLTLRGLVIECLFEPKYAF